MRSQRVQEYLLTNSKRFWNWRNPLNSPLSALFVFSYASDIVIGLGFTIFSDGKLLPASCEIKQKRKFWEQEYFKSNIYNPNGVEGISSSCSVNSPARRWEMEAVHSLAGTNHLPPCSRSDIPFNRLHRYDQLAFVYTSKHLRDEGQERISGKKRISGTRKTSKKIERWKKSWNLSSYETKNAFN